MTPEEKKEFLQTVGMEFRLERIRQRLTQVDLAIKCRLDKRTIGVIETGVESSRMHTLKKVSDGLGKPLSQFFLTLPDVR